GERGGRPDVQEQTVLGHARRLGTHVLAGPLSRATRPERLRARSAEGRRGARLRPFQRRSGRRPSQVAHGWGGKRYSAEDSHAIVGRADEDTLRDGGVRVSWS